MCPGNMHQTLFMDFPVSLGGYERTQTPDDPCVIQMISCPYSAEVGKPRAEQQRGALSDVGKAVPEYESEIREHLTGMLSPKHFDFDRDVGSLTVNRWAHGHCGRPRRFRRDRATTPRAHHHCQLSDSAPAADAIEAMRMGYRAISEPA